MSNIIKLTDSYKLSHAVQYPKGTTNVYSYFEARVGATYPETTFFGLQYLLKEYLAGVVVTQEKLNAAKVMADAHVGPGIFNGAGWQHIIDKHGGRLPVRIKAVPEGISVPIDNVLMTVEATNPDCYWLVNYLETLLVQVWYPSTVATVSRGVKQCILHYLEKTGDPALVDFKLHDFGFRGVSSVESAMLGGGAHLLNFMGTDTLKALDLAFDYYGADAMPGFSIPASEHSTITSWGEANEADAMENMLDQYPKGLVACVSDSFDIYGACRGIWGDKLRDKIMQRDGTLVIRPDSGDPVEVVINVLDILSKRFGSAINAKGYEVLDEHVRVIQGDGCTPDTIRDILKEMKQRGYSADNITFGMGGGLLQKVDRDTQCFAFKCSQITVNGEHRNVFKRPVTDSGKNSKEGRLALFKGPSGYETATEEYVNRSRGRTNILQTVFENGAIVKEYTFREVKENASLK